VVTLRWVVDLHLLKRISTTAIDIAKMYKTYNPHLEAYRRLYGQFRIFWHMSSSSGPSKKMQIYYLSKIDQLYVTAPTPKGSCLTAGIETSMEKGIRTL
jgi:hypothetical protein